MDAFCLPLALKEDREHLFLWEEFKLLVEIINLGEKLSLSITAVQQR
jgi:hypothetical protein